MERRIFLQLEQCQILWVTFEFCPSETIVPGCLFEAALTLVQPVRDAVEDDALLSRRREPPRAALNICLVVNVVFKDIYLWDRGRILVFILKHACHCISATSYVLVLKLQHGTQRLR